MRQCRWPCPWAGWVRPMSCANAPRPNITELQRARGSSGSAAAAVSAATTKVARVVTAPSPTAASTSERTIHQGNRDQPSPTAATAGVYLIPVILVDGPLAWLRRLRGVVGALKNALQEVKAQKDGLEQRVALQIAESKAARADATLQVGRRANPCMLSRGSFAASCASCPCWHIVSVAACPMTHHSDLPQWHGTVVCDQVVGSRRNSQLGGWCCLEHGFGVAGATG
jgi:hypothetical protein